MTNYVLIYSGGGMPETEEEQAAVLAAWGAWYEALGQATVDGGNPFSPMAKSINSDGSVGDAAYPASGYTIITTSSLDAAVEMAKGCPVLSDGGTVNVYETFVIPGAEGM
ncbi:MAG: hypothetical protein AB8I58_10080 [Anaerolineales bacterium]